MSHYYYNDYRWYNGPDEEEDYNAFSGRNMAIEPEPDDRVWEAFQQDRERRPGDAETPRPYRNEQLVKTVQDCGANCEHMTMYVLSQPDIRSRTTQATLLRDCADMCNITAKMLARYSTIDSRIAELCAKICRNCGNECAKFSDVMSQQCARICLETAGGCADYATL